MTTNTNPPYRTHPLCALCGLPYPDSIHLRESTPGYHPYREPHIGPHVILGNALGAFDIPDQDSGLRHWARCYRNHQGALYIEVMETNSQGRDTVLFSLGLDVEHTLAFKEWVAQLAPDRPITTNPALDTTLEP